MQQYHPVYVTHRWPACFKPLRTGMKAKPLPQVLVPLWAGQKHQLLGGLKAPEVRTRLSGSKHLCLQGDHCLQLWKASSDVSSTFSCIFSPHSAPDASSCLLQPPQRLPLKCWGCLMVHSPPSSASALSAGCLRRPAWETLCVSSLPRGPQT